MASEYCDVFLKSLPAEKRENVAAILKVTNLPINKRLEYLADDLDRREFQICKQVIKIEEIDCSTEREEESDRDDLEELQEALEEKNETIKQLRKELAVNLGMTAEHVEKIATLEKATASEKERGCESAAIQRRFLKKEEEFKQENKRNGDQIRKLNEKIADNEAVITELLENLEKARKALDIEKEACKRLLATGKEKIFLKNDLTPFPFLANEPLDTVQIVHTAIQKYTQREADKVDSAILLFLTEENKSAYETWKDELRDGIPTALLNLSIETKEDIMTYFTEKYTPKPGRMQRTLDEIMAIAHKMLESFLNLKKPETSTTVLRSEPLGNIANLVRPEPHEQNKGNRNSFKMETIPENETSRTVQSTVKHCEDKAAQVSDFPYVEQVFKDIESIELSEAMDSDDSILLNILLIGDAVGKSAFINAFQNYLNKESLDKGLQTGPFVRESFDVTVEMDMKPLTVHIDSPSRSDLNIRFLQKRKGTPVVIHGFYDAGRKIQLISTSEAEKEDEEFGYTIDAIKGLERIHAICFLLKSNEGSFSSDFIQALDILRHLPKTAIQNIVFCSTTTDFMPLPTLRVLKEYLVAFEKRTKIRIPASRENIFCFDNASFLFQCLVSKCPQYVGLKKQYVKSWNNDTKQLQEMLKYVQSLIPFSLDDSNKVAWAERRLQSLVDIFMEITKEHVKQTTHLKIRERLTCSPMERENVVNEIDKRDQSFKHILRCCSYLTEFLRRASVGVEDVLGIRLDCLITAQKASFDYSDEHCEVVDELERIAKEYERRISEATEKNSRKDIGIALPDEIEEMLSNMVYMCYYGDRIVNKL